MAETLEELARGWSLYQSGKLQQASQIFHNFLQVYPNNPDVWCLLGLTREAMGELDYSVWCYRNALQINPNSSKAHNELGNSLATQGKFDEAKLSYRRALVLKPDFAVAHNNLGVVLKRQGELEPAIGCFQRALQLQPDFAAAHNNLGIVLTRQGELEPAIGCFQRALQLQPEFVEAHYNLSEAWLLMGDFEQGWREYEWRWRRKDARPMSFSQPLWDGSSLAGQKILLHTEQGIGDALQFIRYARSVKQAGGHVILQCPRPMIPMLSTCPGIDQLIAHGAATPEFNVHAPLMSLPRIFKTTLSTVPAHVPYLFADPERVRYWQQKLPQDSTFRVGIAWWGNPNSPIGDHRFIPLVHFAPIASLKGVQVFSLQKGAGREQLQSRAGIFPVKDLRARLDETNGAFVDTAAVMMNLNLIITADTAIAHLAGALGVPVWVALSHTANWRWLPHRDDSPWYPTMRLFRQTKPGEWDEVFSQMKIELEDEVEACIRHETRRALKVSRVAGLSR